MGAKVSKHSSSKREAKALISSNIGSSSSTQESSIIEAIKPEWLKKRNMKKNRVKRPLQSPERRITKVRKLTLEDWLLASPGPAAELKPDCLNGGELYVFKHFSRRVHPSSSREREAVLLPSTPGDSFSVDLSSGDVSRSSFSRSQSGKLKKKVSFRLPEEADILIFYSPEETFRSDRQSF